MILFRPVGPLIAAKRLAALAILLAGRCGVCRSAPGRLRFVEIARILAAENFFADRASLHAPNSSRPPMKF